MWLRRLAILFGLIWALVGTQAPEFAQQYRQRLGGALDEARAILARFDQESRSLGLDRNGGVRRLESNPDQLARERGREILQLQRQERVLAAAARDLRGAQSGGLLVQTALHLDVAIATQTARNFTPAVPLTLESLITGLIGFAFGVVVFHGAAWPVRRLRARARLHIPAKA